MGLPLYEVDENTWNIEPECSAINVTHTTEEIRQRAYSGLAFVILFLPFQLVSLVLLWSNKHYYPLNKRDNGLVFVSIFAGISAIYLNLGRDIMGTPMFNCDEYLPHAMFWVPLQFGPVVLRVVNIRNRILFNKKKQEVNVMESKHSDIERAILAFKRRTSKRYTAVLICIFLTPSLIVVIIQAITDTRYFNGCLGCYVNSFETLFFGSFGISVIMLSLWTMHRLKKIDPTVREIPEIQSIMRLSLVCGLTFIVTSTFMNLSKAYNTALPLVIIGVFMTYKQAWVPAREARLSKQIRRGTVKVQPHASSSAAVTINGRKSKPKGLVEIIETNEGLEAFTEHVTKEYNVENIKFWHDVVMWKRDYTLNRASPTDLKKRAFNIFSTYVPDSALLQVNLDNSQRETLEKDFAAAKSDDQLVVVNVFDEAEEEILNLMIRDSYPRFKASPAYEKFVAEKWPTAEDW